MSRPNFALLLAGITALAAIGAASVASAQDGRFMRDCETQCTGAAFFQSCLNRCETERTEASRKKRRPPIILVKAPEPPLVAKVFSDTSGGGDRGGGGGGGGRAK